MIKLNPGLFVWEETENIHESIIVSNHQYLMNGTEQMIWGQSIDKTMAKPVGMVKNPLFETRQCIIYCMSQ